MTVIFDFDGTIADSFDYVTAFLESQLRRGRPLSDEEKQAMRGMTMRGMAAHLGCRSWRLPLLFLVGRRVMGRAIYDVPVFEGIGRVIEELHAEGHELTIVSSNNTRNIKKSLKHHHLYKFFTDISGGAGFFGKERAIKRLLRRGRLQAADSIYIGDESRDVAAAHAAGVRVIAVSWGFDTADILQTMKPTAIAHTPQDIVRILEEL